MTLIATRPSDLGFFLSKVRCLYGKFKYGFQPTWKTILLLWEDPLIIFAPKIGVRNINKLG